MELKSKLSNFWYYNKWKILIIGFFAAVIVLCVVQMADQEDHDLRVLYAGPHIFTEAEVRGCADAFAQILPRDFNGDGQKSCEFRDMTIMTDAQLSAALETVTDAAGMVMYNNYAAANVEHSFTQEVFAGENVICLLDPAWYERVRDGGGLVPLAELTDSVPAGAIDAYGIPLRELPFGQFFSAFEVLPEDTVLCIRRVSTASVFTGVKKAQERYEQHVEVFGKILRFAGE